METVDEKKVVRVKLAMFDVNTVDAESVIKKIGPFVALYDKKFDSVRAEVTSSTKDGIEKNYVIISGERKETSEERSNRIGSKPDKSWVTEYAKLVGISSKEAKENFLAMIEEGETLTPKEWFNHKKKKVEGFFNVK